MNFIITCSICHQSIEVQDEWIGRKAKCPSCGSCISITKKSIPMTPVFLDDSTSKFIDTPITLKTKKNEFPRDFSKNKQLEEDNSIAIEASDVTSHNYKNKISNSKIKNTYKESFWKSLKNYATKTLDIVVQKVETKPNRNNKCEHFLGNFDDNIVDAAVDYFKNINNYSKTNPNSFSVTKTKNNKIIINENYGKFGHRKSTLTLYIENLSSQEINNLQVSDIHQRMFCAWDSRWHFGLTKKILLSISICVGILGLFLFSIHWSLSIFVISIAIFIVPKEDSSVSVDSAKNISKLKNTFFEQYVNSKRNFSSGCLPKLDTSLDPKLVFSEEELFDIFISDYHTKKFFNEKKYILCDYFYLVSECIKNNLDILPLELRSRLNDNQLSSFTTLYQPLSKKFRKYIVSFAKFLFYAGGFYAAGRYSLCLYTQDKSKDEKTYNNNLMIHKRIFDYLANHKTVFIRLIKYKAIISSKINYPKE